ncbi:type II toxin-antitoxin system tRNA(fMet)-specific endonuclease VapC [Polaromonas sp.]|uniref:type II toxin-antitoxin system tRNA(fMet)-specific endonuclease VapC n=1 Tax=Polaromonas sp. TaxID=1869339 RepID=UPI003BB4EF6C
MLRYMLDTNIVIYVIKKKPLSALQVFNQEAGHMAISSITLAELLHGAEKSNAPARSLAVVEDFCSRLDVLPYGPKAAQHYGNIRSALENRGQTIGVNDLHIAAHARSEGLTLVSNNLREFERVEALQLRNWIDGI